MLGRTNPCNTLSKVVFPDAAVPTKPIVLPATISKFIKTNIYYPPRLNSTSLKI